MVIAVMQPYFFPYIGYFQLMEAVDVFVSLDDVQYISRGWINRNRIRLGNRAVWVTYPVVHAPQRTRINEMQYIQDVDAANAKILSKIHNSYRRAAFFEQVFPTIEKILLNHTRNVARFNENLIQSIAAQLGIACRLTRASDVENPNGLRGEARIIDICKYYGATRYINLPGGIDIYRRSSFEIHSIDLSFISTKVPPVDLDTEPEHLSVIDALMLRGLDAVAGLLSQVSIAAPK